MTDLLARTIAALRLSHDDLAAVVTGFSEEQLTRPSGASEWTVAQVLSHLGSGAEILMRPLSAAIADQPLGAGDNEAIWDRWNAASPTEQAQGFQEYDARLLETFEGLSLEQRLALRVDLGFLPEPLPLSTVAAMRLNEVAQHAWDVRVADDADATLEPASAEVLAEHFAGDLGFLFGFTATPEAVAQPVRVAAGEVSVVVEDGRVYLRGPVEQPTASFDGPLESLIRLFGGRLTPERTPAGVAMRGNVTLDDLRRLFPGY